MSRPPTIHDVARRAGVSKSLVSLVIRDAPNVSDARRRAVKKAAKELGYRPNAAAKSLVRGRSFVIGVLVADLHDPFFADVIDGVDQRATEADYRSLLNTGARSARRELAAVDTFLQLRVDGLILVGSLLEAKHIATIAESVPVVLASRATRLASVDCIVTDDKAGAIMATDHLISLGHRAIAHISGGPGAGARQRRVGYEAAMRAAGLQSQIRVAAGDFTEEAGARAASRLLRTKATAVFAANDFSAIGAMSRFEERGRKVPDDISLIGYDNSSLSHLGHIDLTTIDQPRAAMGSLAVELLLERMIDRRDEPRRITLAPSLVVRSTTAELS